MFGAGFGIAAAQIAQRVFPIGGAIAALEVAERIFAPDNARSRVFDVAERILTQGALLAIVTPVAGMPQCIFSIGAVGSQCC
jgi:hypothetical protein